MVKRRNILVLVAVVVLAVAGLVAATGGKGTACTGEIGKVYRETIANNQVSSHQIIGKRCDQLTFINKDAMTREIAFGPHENHIVYDGISERVLGKGQSFTITLVKTGTYYWHDHLHDEINGYFSVR